METSPLTKAREDIHSIQPRLRFHSSNELLSFHFPISDSDSVVYSTIYRRSAITTAIILGNALGFTIKLLMVSDSTPTI